MLIYLLVFVATALTAWLLVPVASRLSQRWGLVAAPGGRRQHTGMIPTQGGTAVFFAWLLGVGLTYWLLPPPAQDEALLRGVVWGSGLVFLGGLLDDWFDLSPLWLFLLQIVAALVAIRHELFIERFTNPLPSSGFWTSELLTAVIQLDGNIVVLLEPLITLMTILWVVTIMNAVNMLDGLDGLAAGVCLVAALFFAWHSYSLLQRTVPLFSLVLAGALLGFLPYNFAPARIFLGGGAYLLGYQMATLSILSPAKFSTVLLVLAVPILDVAWQVMSRLRQGKNPFSGDRGHLHFRLADKGLPTRIIVLGYYTIALLFGFVAILVPSARLKLLSLGLLATAVLLLLFYLSRPDVTS
ncbi:MAG: MraY family glycosyltransferase [Chloroflexota bacterium]